MRKASVKDRKLAGKLLKLKKRNRGDVRLQAIIEAILSNGGEANYAKHIYPYIEKYYPELTLKYKGNRGGFTSVVNARVQNYTKGKSNFCGVELFEWVGKGTYRLKEGILQRIPFIKDF